MIRRRMTTAKKATVLYTKRFFPAGTYSWTVPAGCKSVDVFLVGGGAAGNAQGGGGGGFTKTYKKDNTGYKDGEAITVSPGNSISIIVGIGGTGTRLPSDSNKGGSSYFGSYYANGGDYAKTGDSFTVYSGTGGGTYVSDSTNDYTTLGGGTNGGSVLNSSTITRYHYGQGHITRDFGESSGLINAGGGASGNNPTTNNKGGSSDYTEGSGKLGYSEQGFPVGSGGGGYGGGGGGCSGWGSSIGGSGGDGTVLIRYYAY